MEAKKLLDNRIRKIIDPKIDICAVWMARRGITANAITFVGLALGLAAAWAIVWHSYYIAIGFIIVSRIADGLDGAVARTSEKTDLGGFLDIVFDFAFYGLIPMAFVLADPANNAVAGVVLLLSFYVNGASFLAFALMQEKRGIAELARGPKSIFYSVGLAEATETIITFILMCLFPEWFTVIAYSFAVICFYTIMVRIRLACLTFPGNSA